MGQDVRITVPVAKVLAAFLTEPTEHRYGLELMAEAELASALRKAGEGKIVTLTINRINGGEFIQRVQLNGR